MVLLKLRQKVGLVCGKAIIGGASFVANNYIAIGQNTIYFQKFNVVYTASLYSHQYMQNLLAAQNEGVSMKNKYSSCKILESSFTFTIPLYLNMPAASCPRPSITYTPLEEGELVRVNSDPTLKLRDAPNGTLLGVIANGAIVSRLEKATEKVGGYYWDKVSTSIGTGYMAREAADGSKIYLIPISEGTPVDTGSNNNYSAPDSSNIIMAEPNTTVGRIKETYASAIIVDKNGIEIADGTLFGTGARVRISGVDTYTLVKLGDANEDGIIDSADLLKIVKHLKSITIVNNNYDLKAMDANKDEIIDSADLLKIVKHLKNISKINV